MRDQRINRWAEVLINYSLAAKPSEHAVVFADLEALPLLEACHEKLIQAGAFVESFISPKSLSETTFNHASDDQLAFTPKTLLYAVQNCDLYLYLGADANSKLLTNIDPTKQIQASKARQPIMNAIMDRAAKGQVRWCYTHFPTPSAAQESNMGTLEYEEFVFSTGKLNQENPVEQWKLVEKSQAHIIDYLENKKELHFKNGEGTDLKVSIDGMKWVNCCGKINFPDGEVYTGPNLNVADGGVNGVAKYSFPTLYRNTEVHGIELEFKEGAVVSAKASKNESFLKEMIHQDAGAKFVGEIAIGTNYEIQNVTKNILFDEKFGGTFHLALGKGYPQTGNTNQSALHWDIIFDLRKEGSITADGELFFENGKFLI